MIIHLPQYSYTTKMLLASLIYASLADIRRKHPQITMAQLKAATEVAVASVFKLEISEPEDR